MNSSHRPLVSIIIPCFNARATLSQTIQCALDQTWDNKEVIVIDDGSTDGSLEGIQAFGSRIHWVSGPNRGGCAARNRGLEIAKGEYIQFLDADDLMDVAKIERQLEMLKSRSGDSIATCPWSHFSSSVGDRRPRRRPYWKDFPRGIDLLVQTWLEGGYFAQHCWLVPRSLIESSGGWNESLTADQDGDFFGRLLAASGPVTFVPDVNAYYRSPNSSGVSAAASSKALRSRYVAISTVAQLILDAVDSDDVRKAVRDRWHGLAYYASQHDMDIAVEAAAQARLVTSSLADLRTGGSLYQLAARLFGLERALRLRSAIVKTSARLMRLSA